MKNLMIGNVVKLANGSIVIITNVNDDTTSWVAFDYSNCSGATKNKSYVRMTACFCCENNGGEYDTECECEGKGEYPIDVNGMDKAKYLADNVKEYIIERLTKKFEF